MNFLTKLLKRVFNRTTVCVIGIVFQVGYLVSLFWTLGTLYTYSYLVFEVIAVVIALLIVNSDMNPSYKTAWIILILSFPIFGVMFYIFFGNSHSGDRLRKRMNRFNEEERLLLPQNDELVRELCGETGIIGKQARYLYRFGGYPVYKNTSTTYFPGGEAKFEALVRELEKAERFIFLEYFIIQEGKMWNTILDILERKAKEGVDVRVVYDDIGCLLTLPYRYYDKLEKKGIRCKVFNEFKPIWSAKMNNRDHRKILVIDGHTAFNGGINLADEYINAYEKHGRWKDSAVMLKGEAVWSFTMMFLTMWNYLNGSKPASYDYYMPRAEDIAPYKNGGYVIPYTDSPLDDEPVGENVYLNIINDAKDYVYITTPYLIIDNEMVTALTLAAKSGVDVRIITPHIADKWFVHAVTRAYYKKLIKLGVKIYEYTPGFIHAKNFVSDDSVAVVGTINLDFRSLYLHFECATWMYKTDCVSDVKADYLKTLEECREITYEDCLNVNIFVRLGRALLRLFSPMM
ncbi:MAG: cardiolipin synthase [Lachnospiraceae bacterium]|nr:cardiolipin synthase [Ruminococcus sp.]MCM1274087.1 cardiolipin synthase [Lachnospiraceae bacterium]